MRSKVFNLLINLYLNFREGVQPRDVIIRINGVTATSANDIYKALEKEQSLKLTIRRGDREINLVVKPQAID